MTKKISKVIVYYEDGTYEEITHSVSPVQSEKNKEHVSTNPVTPDFRPDYQKITEWPMPRPTWVPPDYTQPARDQWPYEPMRIWCTDKTTGNMTLNYTINPAAEMSTWSFTSTGNADNLNKYTITSTGNGNVDLSK